MFDLCHVNPLACLNNGQCAVNNSINTTYCQCDSCHTGINCEHEFYSQSQFDTTYTYMIVYMIGLCISLLNNSLSLELCIRSKLIRQTNCGIYLIIYCILSVVANILLVADATVQYYPNQLRNDEAQHGLFGCYVSKVGYNMLIYLCIWLSSCIALERGLVLWFGGTMSTSRWVSLVTIIVIFVIAAGCATPLLWYKCGWDSMPSLHTARGFFIWFYPVMGITICVLATVLVLISFAHRIRPYGLEKGPFIKTFLKLLYSHLFIFVPPIAYVVGYIPYSIVYNSDHADHSYLPCGISTVVYIIKVLVETLQGVPFAITWLIFVYPSNIYMNEFYLKTWSGQRSAKIIIFFKSCWDRQSSAHPPTRSRKENNMAMEIFSVQTNN